MPFTDHMLLGSSGGAAAYTINQSCRFNDDDSAYMTRTFGSAGDRRTFTLSFWAKTTNQNAGAAFVFSATDTSGAGTSSDAIRFDGATGALRVIGDSGTGCNVLTQAYHRDHSAWYHFVVTVDTTEGAAGDRVKIYRNGVQDTNLTHTTDPSASYQFLYFNNTEPHSVGREEDGAAEYFDGYLADVYWIDGTAYAASDFGETDTNGNWVPIDASSLTFGTNGAHFLFEDSANLGNDSNGGTDWTENGLAANDQVTDSPTDDLTNLVGNYCVWNPVDPFGAAGLSLANGNLQGTNSSAAANSLFGSMVIPATGKWAWQITCTTVTGGGAEYPVIGVVPDNNSDTSSPMRSGGTGEGYGADGRKFSAIDAANAAYGDTFTDGDVIEVQIDMDAGDLFFRKNGTLQNSGTAMQASLTSGVRWKPAIDFHKVTNNIDITADFGQLGFTPTDSSYKTLFTANFDAPTITDPSAYFQVDTFTGTGAELARTLTDASGGAVSPDLVWISDRDTTVNEVLVDSVRGATLEWNFDSANTETTVAQGVKSFDSSGYTLGTDTNYNASGSSNKAQCYVESATAGFDIVTFTGNGSARTISHSLGAVPAMYWVKERNATSADFGAMYHQYMAATPEDVYLDIGDTVSPVDDATLFNDTAPTSSVFSVGTSNQVNENSKNYVAYLWAEVEGFSKFFQYESNNTTPDGTFVWCGFRPAFVVAKPIDSALGWYQWDSAVSPHNLADIALRIDDGGTDESTHGIDILSNGFKFKDNGGGGPNSTGTTCIGWAFAEFPFGGSGVSQARAR